LNHIQDLIPLEDSLLHYMILGSVLHSGNASAKSFTITEKAELLIHIMTSYEAALLQKRTLKIWNNHDKDDAWPLS
jgi:hypothetical protein